MLTDLAIVRQNCKRFKRLLPEVELLYAIKALSDREVIETVNRIADGYDVASITEIKILLQSGISPKRIAFSNPVKPQKDIQKAFQYGVKRFAFQSQDELAKLAACAPGSEVYVRVKMDDDNSVVPLSEKYGCHPSQVIKLLLQAQKCQLKPVGVTFHVGSQQTGFRAWRTAICNSQKFIEEARADGLNTMHIINLGGGFPTQYEATDPAIESVAAVINKEISANSVPNVKYIAEPGRFIVANSSVILATIIGIEKRGASYWMYLDLGVFQAFIGALRHDRFPYYPFSLRHIKDKPVKRARRYVISGPTCDSQDIIAHDAMLPSDMQVGDVIIFPNTGAYTVVYGTYFNGFQIPERVFINNH